MCRTRAAPELVYRKTLWGVGKMSSRVPNDPMISDARQTGRGCQPVQWYCWPARIGNLSHVPYRRINLADWQFWDQA